MQTDYASENGTERLVSLQVLRAIAAIVVVLAHISAFATGGNPIHHFPNFFLGNAGVDLFFIISGFTMVYTTREKFGRPGASIDFAWRRFIRVVPIYWIVTSWFLSKQHAPDISTALAKAGSSFANMFGSYFFIPIPRPNGTQAPILLVGWTLNFEMLFYAVFTIALLSSRRLVSIACVTIFLYALALLRSYLPLGGHYLLAEWGQPLILEFALGMWLAVAYEKGLRIKPIISCAMIATGAAMFWFERSHGAREFVRLYDWGLASLLFVAAILLVKFPAKTASAKIAGPLRFMVLVGDASYVLYLTHLFVILMPKRVLRLDPSTSPWVFAFASLVFTISIAIGIHLLLEKPLTRFLKSLPAVISKWRSGDLALPALDYSGSDHPKEADAASPL